MRSFSEFIIESKIDFDHPTFIRWGGLSSVSQDGYLSQTDDYHRPPARRGIYAFVDGLVEDFLLGTASFNPTREKWVKDKEGNIIDEDHPDFAKTLGREHVIGNFAFDVTDRRRYYTKMTTKGKSALVERKPARKFKYNGDIWHHLGKNLSNSEILKRKDSWYLTSMPSFMAALKKELGATKFGLQQLRKTYPHVTKSSRDHLEVFIEKV